MASTISYERAQELLDYSIVSGKFYWKCYRGPKANKGDVAGSVSKEGYILIRIGKHQYRAHRLAFFMINNKWPTEIDHINQIRSCNTFWNIREVTRQDNQRNQTLPSNNRSGHIGVCYRKDRKRWWADIKINGKKIFLGSSKDIDDAVKLRKDAEIKYGFHENHGRLVHEN